MIHKLIGLFWLFVFLGAIAGVIWLGFADIPVEQQNVVIDIPAEDVLQ
ncbi:MAG: hypothetical protein AAF988_00745 [Pseudomonadota bacterium]